MKSNTIFKFIVLCMMVTLAWSCEREYEAPSKVPSNHFVTTSFGTEPPEVLVGVPMQFVDVSAGVLSREWIFPSNAGAMMEEGTLLTADKLYVSFNVAGVHNIQLKQTYQDTVYVEEVKQDSPEYTTDIEVTVLDSVKVGVNVIRVKDGSELTLVDGTNNEVQAGREIKFEANITGEPTGIVWTLTKDGIVTNYVEEESAFTTTFSSMGDYTVRLIARHALHSDTFLVNDLMRVIPSTDPINLTAAKGESMTKKLMLEFSRNMADPTKVPLNAFTLTTTNNGNPVADITVNSISIDESSPNIVVLDLSDNIYNTDIISVKYDATIGDLISEDGKTADTFTSDVTFDFPNLLKEAGFNVGLEEAEEAHFPYSWWTTTELTGGDTWAGYNWNAEGKKVNSEQKNTGSKSLYLDMHMGEAGMMNYNTGSGNLSINLVVNSVYKTSVMCYVKQVGNTNNTAYTLPGATVPYVSVPNVQFHDATNWSGAIIDIPFDAATVPLNTWYEHTMEWTATKTKGDGSATVVIRTYAGASDDMNTQVYLDDFVLTRHDPRP